MEDVKIPDGNRNRVSLGEATDEQLKGYIAWQTKQFDDGKVVEQYAEQNKRQLAAAERELERRVKPNPQAQKPVVAEKKRDLAPLGRAIHDPAAVTAHLAELAEHYHVVGPATRVDVLPEGCGVAISYVQVSVADCYDVGGKKGLSAVDLKRIAVAAGLVWDMRQSGRLDNGRDPHYCHFRAVGHVRNFDGSIVTVSGEVEIDMREGSPQVEEIRAKSAAAAKKYNKADDRGVSQIREIRKFIIRHAETKAKNRAIVDMGVRRSYAPAELLKPFACARLTWTGETQDPELKREFAREIARNFLGGSSVLYGTTGERGLPGPREPYSDGYAPPPIGSVGGGDFDFETDGEGEDE